MFGPLHFNAASAGPPTDSNLDHNQNASCLFCHEEFSIPKEEADILQHLFLIHHFIIAEGHVIGNLKNFWLSRYLDFWRIRFKSDPDSLENFCTKFKVDIEYESGIQKDVECYMLSDNLQEDKYLRQRLHEERLESALAQQKFEREDESFKRCCLFCRYEETGTRAKYLQHLAADHNLQLGRPDNLVYIDRFLDCIENKIKNLICIYCERIFKDRAVLREHMRKKAHKRPNPNNLFYNQFYLVNYREMGKTWQEEAQESVKKHYHSSGSEDDDADWSDWKEKEDANIVCLFCPLSAHSWIGILLHMTAYHNFDYQKTVGSLDFYEQIKIVNFIRCQILNSHCIVCDHKSESNSDLLKHMEESKHYVIPDKKLWNHPEFFFPTYEDDDFLTHLEDNESKDLAAKVNQEKLTEEKSTDVKKEEEGEQSEELVGEVEKCTI